MKAERQALTLALFPEGEGTKKREDERRTVSDRW